MRRPLLVLSATVCAIALIAGAVVFRTQRDRGETRGSDNPAGEAASWARTGRNFLEWGVRGQAIDFLERAVRRSPDDPVLLADLATALLLQQDGDRHVADHVRALELSTRSFEIDPTLLSACRSRAGALQLLFLNQSAIEALDRCLELDIDSTTALAIRSEQDDVDQVSTRDEWESNTSRLVEGALSGDDALVSALASRFPTHVRDLVERDLMLSWADQRQEARFDAAERDRQVMHALADALLGQVGDRFTTDAVAILGAATSESFGQAYRDYRRGAVLSRAGDCDEAQPLLRQARDDLRAINSPYHLWASFRLAVCDYSRAEYESADARFEELRLAADRLGYLSLLGNVRWMEGLSSARQVRVGVSLVHYDAAANIFASTGDETRFAGVSRLIASNLDIYLGRHDDAWRQRRSGLSRLDRITDPRTRHQVLFEAANAAFEQGWPRAAIDFEESGVASAREREAATEFITGSVRLATFLQAAERADDAQQVLADARAWLSRMTSSTRPELEAELATTEGRLLLTTDALDSVRLLDEAIAFYEIGTQARLAELYPLRGRANLEAGRISDAEDDLEAGIEFFEGHRGEVFEQRDRISYGDVAHRVYDEMIRFQIAARHRSDVALAYAERSRARLLLERVGGAGQALTADEIRTRTPEDVALIYYAVLEDRLLIWASAGGSLHHVETPIDVRELTADVDELRSLLDHAKRSDRSRRLLEQLYDLLIRPVSGSVNDQATFVVLPDKALHLVPFSALVDRRTGRHIVQDHQLAVSLSATLLLDDRDDRPPAHTARGMEVLIVANPSFDRDTYRLPDLTGAALEARMVRDVYDASTILEGHEATRQRFLAKLDHSTILHFAGHAVPNPGRPLLSRLLLAPDPVTGDPGVVLARDLYDREAGPTRLVVLAACDTAAGGVSSAEGPISLARPFLATGVPTVLATLWKIDDAASPELFFRFHESYRATGNPLSGLRAAQVWMLEQQSETLNRPGAWAATQVFLGAGVPHLGGNS